MTDPELTYLWLLLLAASGGLGAVLAHAVDAVWLGRRRFPSRRSRTGRR